MMASPTAATRQGVQWREHAIDDIERACATEAAIGLSFDGRPHTVLMATPQDLADLPPASP